MRPVNPFHVYPVYDRDNDLSKVGYFSAPTYRTVSLQFLRSGTHTVSNFDLVTDTGTVLSQATTEVGTYEISGGKTFYWTKGNNLDNPPESGTMYRPRITLSNGSIYWGHMVCANALFDTAYPSLRITGFAASTISLDPTYPVGANVQIKIEDDNSSYEENLDVSSPSFVINDLTASGGDFAATITITSYLFSANGGSRRVSVAYPFTAAQADVSGTAALGTGVQSAIEEIDLFELTLYNSTDIQSQELYYGGGFRQKMWFVGEFLDPVARVTENYLENGEGDTFFQSARVGDARVVEFWPCPDQAGLGLAFSKYHDNITLNGAGTSTQLYRMEFELVPVENEDRGKGRITAEYDGAFIQSIMSDYESA